MDIFKDREYCISELSTARKVFTSKKLFTEDKVEPMEKSLALMFLYCPEDLQVAVLACLKEVTLRASYL